MAQPATSFSAFEFTSPLLEDTGLQPAVRQGEGPANRALSELTLALSHEAETQGGAKWSMGQSLRFVVVSCGLFWLLAITAFYTLH